MKRTLVKETSKKIGETIMLRGWVHVRRDHGKLIFIDLRDRTGIVQVVFLPQTSATATELAGQLRSEYVVEIEGKVNQRPEKLVNPKLETGTIEIEALSLKILAKAAPLPFDIGGEKLDLELPTLLDHRALTLRHPSIQAIFAVQATVIDAFRQYLQQEGFMEFQAPSITPAVAEGGAEVFQVDYFDHKAFLTQSPQLYKQIVMTAFERVFSVNKVFRAEPSVTTRHLTEIVSLDAEFGFIDSWTDVRDMAEAVVRHILGRVQKDRSKELGILGATLPTMIEKTPTYSLREVQQKIFESSGRDVRGEKDLNPEDEREICAIVKQETDSDFVFVYGYPTKKKPFYVYPNPEEPEYNEGMDLLCRGIEWLSGGRRVNDYEQLMRHVQEWNMDPAKIEMFLEAFRYGVPPEGGFAFGAERITMQILGLSNIREASLFPRDMERIDFRFSASEPTEKVDKTKTPFERIVAKLGKANVKYELIEHEPVFTSEQAAKVRGEQLHQGAKALVMQADKKYILVVLPGDQRADMEQIKEKLKVKRVAMASKEDVLRETGIEVGSIPPLGSAIGMETYLDPRFQDNETMFFNPGRHDATIQMNVADYLRVEKPTIL